MSPARPGVVWRAPLFDVTGYASEARHFVLGLDALGAAVRAEPVWWALPACPLPESTRRRLIELTRARAGRGAPRVHHDFPPHWGADARRGVHVGRTMFETDRIPVHWVPACNAAREVWVPTRFNVETFAASGVRPEKLVVVPSPIRVADYDPVGPPLAMSPRRGFTFLSVFDWSLRKGWDVLLRAYCTEFARSHDDVALVLRVHSSYGCDGEALRRQICRFVRGRLRLDPDRAPEIVVLDRFLADADMPRLYRAADCFVLPTRGEGWGRPFVEAMAAGLPTIGTRWSGPTEYMHDGNAYPIDVEGLVPVPAPAVREAQTFRGHRWAAPSVDHLRWLMRHVYEHRDEARARGRRARAEVRAKYDVAAVCRHVAGRLAELTGSPARTAAPNTR